MDSFGIGAAVAGAAEVYFRSARQSGRTTAMLAGLKPGDRVVCLTVDYARELERHAKSLGITGVIFTAVPVNAPRELFNRQTSEGRTMFEHMWLEEYYRARIKDGWEIIDHLERQTSGPGMAHAETRLAAENIRRWRE